MADLEKISKQERQTVETIKKELDDLALKEFPDEIITQFLQANNWNENNAKAQLLDTFKWRKEMKIDEIPVATKYNNLPIIVACRGYEHVNDGNFKTSPELSESTIRILNYTGGDCFHKFDKEGHPVMIDRTGYHNAKYLGGHVNSQDIVNYHISANEFLNRVIMPEGSKRAGRRIHSETIIFDCTNMGLHQFHMNAFYLLKSVADIVQRYYPETLHRLFIVNSPAAFVAMFKVIKAWLNPRTLEKIHVLGSDYQSVLLEHIDSDSLPEFLGGQCRCEHMGGCVPLNDTKSGNSFTVTEANEKVHTVYNTDIMKRASTDESIRNLIVQ